MHPPRRRWLRRALAAGTAAALPRAALAAAPVADPLARPALPVRDAARGVLLGLARAGTRLVAVGERGLVLLSDDAGRTWRQAPGVPTSATLTAVQFVDARHGWAVGHYGLVLHSGDGGEHWTRRLDGTAAAALVEAAAREQAERELGPAAQAALAEAQRLVQEGPDKPLFALRFDDAGRGVVAGAYNLMFATEDGGGRWTSVGGRLDNPRAAHLYALDGQGAQRLLAGEQGLLLHSADAGARWARVPTPYAGSWFTAALLPDASWLVAGLRGTALRSRDGGRRWSRLDNPVPAGITALARDAQGLPWLANQAGQLLTPDDAGSALRVRAQTRAMQPAALLALDDGGWLLAGWNGLTRVDAPAGTAR